MRTFYKKWLQVILSVVFCAAALAALTACGGVTRIAIGRDDMPRLTYVQGQELDLSGGTLTVERGGGAERIPLDSEGVEVTGYDKDVLGEQTVTVGYEGQKVSFAVTVIPRASVSGAQTVYYVGEAFDASRGSLTIADENAVTSTVSFAGGQVTFRGFDSSEPAEAQVVTAEYVSGTQTYSASFTVTIYTTENATLTPPTRTNYQSHESFRVSGAYITYSNGNPAFDKNIPVTEEMVSGLDFSLVTEENSPMQQTGIVTYGGREYPFTVTVTYSAVTKLQASLAALGVSWTEPDIPVLTEEQGEAAAACAEAYLALSPSQRTYLDVTDVQTAVRAAAAYARSSFDAALAACAEAFSVAEGEVRYKLANYAAVQAAAEAAADPGSGLNARIPFLVQLSEEFPDLTVGGEKMTDYLASAAVYGERAEEIAQLLGFCTELADALAQVPSGWQEDVSRYGAEAERVKALVTQGEFGGAEYRSVFSGVASWREDGDFFDIVYAYFLDAGDTASLDALKDVILPEPLEELYYYILSDLSEYLSFAVGSDGLVSSDSTLFMYYRRLAQEQAEEILTGGNALYAELYSLLAFDDLLSDENDDPLPATFDDLLLFLDTTSMGYYTIFCNVLDSRELTALWDSYLALLEVSSDEEMGEALHTFLTAFGLSSPAIQKSFLYSVNVYYMQYEKGALDVEVEYTYLIRALKGYYSEAYTAEEFALFADLLRAIESYATVSEDASELSAFLSLMQEVSAGWSQLPGTSVLKSDYSEVYERAAEYAALYREDGTRKDAFEVDAAWQEVLDEIGRAAGEILLADSYIYAEDEAEQEDMYVRVLASYDVMRRGVLSLAADGVPQEVRASYALDIVDVAGNAWTLEYAVEVAAGQIGMIYYTTVTYGDYPLWDIVGQDEAFRSFMALAAPVVWTEADGSGVTAEQAAAVMQAFCALDGGQQELFRQLQGMTGEGGTGRQYYYEGLSAVFAQAFSGRTALIAAAEALLKAEQAMLAYRAAAADAEESEDASAALGEARSALDRAMQTLSEAEAQLGGEDAAAWEELFAAVSAGYAQEYAALGEEAV